MSVISRPMVTIFTVTASSHWMWPMASSISQIWLLMRQKKLSWQMETISHYFSKSLISQFTPLEPMTRWKFEIWPNLMPLSPTSKILKDENMPVHFQSYYILQSWDRKSSSVPYFFRNDESHGWFRGPSRNGSQWRKNAGEQYYRFHNRQWSADCRHVREHWLELPVTRRTVWKAKLFPHCTLNSRIINVWLFR